MRYIAKTGCNWRRLPNDLPPRPVVYQQMRRWIDARCFETIVEDLRMLLREYMGRKPQQLRHSDFGHRQAFSSGFK